LQDVMMTLLFVHYQ